MAEGAGMFEPRVRLRNATTREFGECALNWSDATVFFGQPQARMRTRSSPVSSSGTRRFPPTSPSKWSSPASLSSWHWHNHQPRRRIGSVRGTQAPETAIR